jgi:hypothetical protein
MEWSAETLTLFSYVTIKGLAWQKACKKKWTICIYRYIVTVSC